MLYHNIICTLSFLKPIDILNYSITNTTNKYYIKNSIIWKNLFMRDFYYNNLKLDIQYMDLFFINKYTVNYVLGPHMGWLYLYKYNNYRYNMLHL